MAAARLCIANVQNRVFLRELLPTQTESLSDFVPTELARWNG
jgi:hypothetical protein